MLYLWCLATQCEIFEDILVGIGGLGGSSSDGVKKAQTQNNKRMREKVKIHLIQTLPVTKQMISCVP